MRGLPCRTGGAPHVLLFRQLPLIPLDSTRGATMAGLRGLDARLARVGYSEGWFVTRIPSRGNPRYPRRSTHRGGGVALGLAGSLKTGMGSSDKSRLPRY